MKISLHPLNLVRRSILALTAAVFLAIALIANGPVANAGLAFCRSDPLVILSDGTILDISADVGALLFDIKEVQYTLHIPEGLRVVAAVSTPNWPTTLERFDVHADNPPGTFTSTTTVITRRAGTAVTANFLVNTVYRVLDGVSGQGLTLEIKF